MAAGGGLYDHPAYRGRRLPRRLARAGLDVGASPGSGDDDRVADVAHRIVLPARLRDQLLHDVPDFGDRYEWPGTADPAKLALQEDWARFVARIEALGDERLLAPMGKIAEPHGWPKASYLALALHALDEVAHHGGEIGLMRDLYARQPIT